MIIASSLKQIQLNHNKNMALFFILNSKFWLYFTKKLNPLYLINNSLEKLKPNYKAASLILIMKPAAS